MSEPIRYRFAKVYGPGPNCLWEIRRPDLGFVGTGPSWNVFVNNVAEYRKANGLPVGLGFEQELEWAVCEWYMAQGMEGLCVSDDPKAPITPRAMTYREVLTGTEVMFRIAKERLQGRNPLVSQEEANRRAAICATCKFNVPFTKPCGGICGELKTMVDAVVGGAATPQDDRLFSCYLCGCYLQSAVLVDGKLQTDPLPEVVREKFLNQAGEWCWKAAILRDNPAT